MYTIIGRQTGSIGKFLILAGLSALLSGCPAFDPHTASLVENDTGAKATIELVLDMHRFGIDDAKTAREYASDWLQAFADSQDVSLQESDPTKLHGRYEVIPGGTFVLHESLGTAPYFTFSSISIESHGQILSFPDRESFENYFRENAKVDNSIYRILLSEVF